MQGFTGCGTDFGKGGTGERERIISRRSFRWRAAESVYCPCTGKNPKLLLCDEPTGALD